MISWPWPDGDSFFRDRKNASPSVTLDARLAELAEQRLRIDTLTRDAHITVAVQNGVAMLSGTVADPAISRVAEQTARNTQGIREVCNMLATAGRAQRTADDLETTLAGSAREPRRDRLAGPAAPVPESREGVRAGTVAAFAVAWWLACLLVAFLGWAGAAIALLAAMVAAKLFWVRRAGR